LVRIALAQKPFAGHHQPGAVRLIGETLELALLSQAGVINGEWDLLSIAALFEFEQPAISRQQINVTAGDGDRLEIALLTHPQRPALEQNPRLWVDLGHPADVVVMGENRPARAERQTRD